MTLRSDPTRNSRTQQQRAVLDLLREVGGDRARAATRLGLDPAEMDARIRKLGILRQAAALAAAASEPTPRVQVRRPGEKVAYVRPSAPTPPPLPKRGAGRPPRGRLTRGNSAQRDRHELGSEKGRALLRELITAHRGHAPMLLRRLNELYVAAGQRPMTEADVDTLIARHGLTAEVEAASNQRLQALLQQHRGDLKRMAADLKLTRDQLRKDLERRGLWDMVERARDRFRREIFSKPLTEQAFMLIERRATLADLGALTALERDLAAACQTAWEKAHEPTRAERVRRLASLLAIGEERARQLGDHFRLA